MDFRAPFHLEVDGVHLVFEPFNRFNLGQAEQGMLAMVAGRPPGMTKEQALDIQDGAQQIFDKFYLEFDARGHRVVAQGYAELTLAQFLQKMFNRNARDLDVPTYPIPTPEEIKAALKPYTANKHGDRIFNMDKGAPAPEPEVWPPWKALPPLVLGQARELNTPESDGPSKFLIEKETVVQPDNGLTSFRTIQIIFLDGQTREVTQSWIEEFSHPL